MRSTFLLLLLSILCIACATKLSRLTLFYKETDLVLVNLNSGEPCSISGVSILPERNEERTSFSNCDVTLIRKIKEWK